jgi:hypothetical protein
MSLYYYCIHTGKEIGEEAKYNFITFCPIHFWREFECLPDFFFADQIDNMRPNQYRPVSQGECMWSTEKSFTDIRKELNLLGFTENLNMKQFLDDCYEPSIWVHRKFEYETIS